MPFHVSIIGPFLLESYNFKGYGFAVDNKGEIYIGRGGTRIHFVYPGLTGKVGTVSIEMTGSPGKYLRHRSYLLHADILEESDNKELFRGETPIYYNIRTTIIPWCNKALCITVS